MILDTSAILAILLGEPGHDALLRKLLTTERKGVAAPTLLESAMVLSRRHGADAPGIVDRWVRHFDVSVVNFGEPHWRAAAEAFQRFGKGRHPAALNFGDCLSYATARLADRPLLFVGEDFTRTDLRAA